MQPRRKKGYALFITVVVILALSITALTTLSIVLRYTTAVKSRKSDLFENVKDSGNGEEGGRSASDDISRYILYT